MMKNLCLAITLLIGGLIAIPRAQAQTRIITGTVTDETGQKLPGATVTVLNQTTGTVTDINGAYSLSVDNAAETLVFSFVGYLTQELPINGRSTINLSLEPDV